MKIATLVVFKNEADILPYWLNCMSNHIDYFLFLDNESTDNGFDIVSSHPKTVHCEKVKGIYHTSMRDVLFKEVQNFLSDSDWICGGAPDLIPFFDVRKEIEQADKEGYTCIKAYYPTFFFTKEMYKSYKHSKYYKDIIDNFSIRNYQYYANASYYFENMMKNTKDKKGNRVRYERRKQEPVTIPNKKPKKSKLCWGHYRFRSPEQMKERFRVRKIVNPNHKRNRSFSHYPTWNWTDYLVSKKRLYKYEGSFNNIDRTWLDQIINPKKEK